MDQAARNMRFNLTGQSYGGTFCQMLVNCLYEKMKNIHYDDNEIQEVFDNIIIFSISGALPVLETGKPSPKIVFLEHEFDFVGFQMSRHGVHPKLKQNENLRIEAEDSSVLEISERRKFFWTNFLWKEEDETGVEKPSHDSYGYNDIRAVLQAVPHNVITALQTSSQAEILPPLEQLLSEMKPDHAPLQESTMDAAVNL